MLAQLKEAWREDRKPANVLLVLDTSGSMGDEDRLENAKDGLRTFLSETAPQDRVGLTIFSDQIQPLIPVGPFKREPAAARADDRPADPRGRHGDLRRDVGGLRGRARPRGPGHEPHQRRRRAHRRRGHRLLHVGRRRCSRTSTRATARIACACSRSPTARARRAPPRRSRRSPPRPAASPTRATPRTSGSVYRSISSFF